MFLLTGFAPPNCMNLDYYLREFVEINGNVLKNKPETKNGNENLSSPRFCLSLIRS